MSAEGTARLGETVVDNPFGLLKLAVDQRVYVKLRGERELQGKLYAYDQHLNMALGDVEETHTSIEVDEETLEETTTNNIIRIDLPVKRQFEFLWVRGDGVILVAPPMRT